MNTLPNELLDMLVRGGLLLPAACMASLALRRRCAALQSSYWRCAIIAVLMVPLVPTLWTMRQTLGDVPVKLVVETPPAEAVSVEPPPVELAVDLPYEFPTAAPEAFPEPGRVEAAAGAGETRVPGALTAVRPIDSRRIAGGLAAMWFVGVFVVFGRWLFAALRFRLLWRQSVPAGDAAVVGQFHALAEATGLRRAPRLMTHPEIAVPMVGGVFRGRVLLPNDCARWASEDRRIWCCYTNWLT